MIKDKHNDYRRYYSYQVPDNHRQVVVFGCPVRDTSDILIEGPIGLSPFLLSLDDALEFADVEHLEHVEAQAEGHEDAWDHDVAQAQDRVLGRGGGQVLRELELDRGVHVLSHCKHHVGAEDKEDVVEEEESQEEGACFEVTQEYELEGVHAKDYC